jgi:hypothetical protein
MAKKMVKVAPFGYICGHASAAEYESLLLEKKQEFYASLLDEATYNKECERIIDSFQNDILMKGKPWHKRLIEMSRLQQPSWQEYIDSCEFRLMANYIVEGGVSNACNLQTAEDGFEYVCNDAKGLLIKEVSTAAAGVLAKNSKLDKSKGLRMEVWSKMYDICDKLQNLSFVSPNIHKAEQQIRSVLDEVLPKSGTISGSVREDLAEILSALVDPLKLSDKIDNQQPVFVVDSIAESDQQSLLAATIDNESGQVITNDEEETEIPETDSTEDVLAVSSEEAVAEECQIIPVMQVEEIQSTDFEEDSFDGLEEESISGREVVTEADEFISDAVDALEVEVMNLDGNDDDILASLGF